MPPWLELRDLAVGYQRTPVLQKVDLVLGAGEIVTLVGANGAGKSTLLKAISGILRPLRGDILFEGKAINGLSPMARLRAGIAHVPEGRQIFSGMTVQENLDLGAYADRHRAVHFDDRIRQVCEIFPAIGERLHAIAGNFSGGQQQMLAIARGLMSSPRLLLLDEPSLGVAPLLVAEIFNLIQRLRDRGVTILLAEQNASQALSIADRGYVVENGALIMAGTAAELLASPEIAERYLGVGAVAARSSDADAAKAAHLRACLS